MMKLAFRISVSVLAAFAAASCGTASADRFDIELYAPQYASGFVISGAEGWQSTILRSRNPWQGADNVEKQLFISRNGEVPPAGFRGEVLASDPVRIICISSSHVAMLDMLGESGRVVGVSGAGYITNEYVASNRDRIGDVGYEGNIDYELTVALQPDIVLLYGIDSASGMEGKLRELGIPFVYIGDYLEDSPLGKAEWMVAVGEIVGRREDAAALFAGIPLRYEALKDMAAAAESKAPAVMVNTPYGDSWFMSPAGSYTARMIADAGGDYLYRDNATNRSLPVDMEEAALLVSKADVWINVGSYRTIGELSRALPKFADARCVREGGVWNFDLRANDAGGNDYWESGVVHPDIVLRDMIKIFHPELISEEFVYYRKLQ